MPRFARLFEAAAETLNAFYQALAEGNIDELMALWIDEDFASFIDSSGAHWHGIDSIRAGVAQLAAKGKLPTSVEPLDVRVYDSLGTAVYAVAEAHQLREPKASPRMVYATYVLVHERGTWRIAHIHASPMPAATANEFAAKVRHGQGALH
ncbi:nuclear transport factor 2 family protein [Trinickia sp. LjRoot230]|uniref:nuclear transport factor 2 family protein n=1 Tax=Trinickia sp. LjRoot230 TaxID=3342288 RepID=UPI003ECD60B7